MKILQEDHDALTKALSHRTEELSAQYDSLLNNTASKEAATRIETKLDVLAIRILEQETDIRLLKKAPNRRLAPALMLAFSFDCATSSAQPVLIYCTGLSPSISTS